MAAGRKASREIAYKMLFSLPFETGVSDFVTAFEIASEGQSIGEAEKSYIEELYSATTNNIDSIDKIISEKSIGFSFDRIFKTDLAAIRMGVAEIKYMGTNNIVAIDAAVEIAKKYGTKKSGSFVNGVLAQVI